MGEQKKINGLSMNEWISKETTKRKTTFWGQKCEIEPQICETILGDGLQLAYLGTIDQRPNYWLIRIDSQTDLSSDEFDFEEILEPIEEFFGRHPGFIIDEEEFIERAASNDSELENFENFDDYNSSCEYPAVWWQGGHWGTIVNFGTDVVGNQDR